MTEAEPGSPGAQGPRDAPNRIPVSVITGFLGSGKTTLINHLLNDTAMADAALIVNEFGDVGIDHALVDSAFENTILMESGCICCTIRGDLVDTISDLFAKAANGSIPDFSKIVIETTGLADPVPILHALEGEAVVAERCRVDTVVTTVDAQFGLAQLDEHEEAVRQIALADVVLITKMDLAPEDRLRAIAQRVAATNPGIAVFPVVHGDIAADKLFGTARIAASLPEGHAHHHDYGTDHAADANRHGDIRAHAIRTVEPLDWDRLRRWLETIISLRGDAVLRIKGILALRGRNDPLLLQGVGTWFSAPVSLQAWPDGDRASRIVLITKGLEGAGLQQSFERMVLAGTPASDTETGETG